MIDGSNIRAHQHAAGARGGQEDQALGRSRGGFGTKIHMVVDSFACPVDYRLTGGESHEMTQAESLLADKECDYLLADKGYDSDEFRTMLKGQNIIPVIPPRRNRSVQIEYDKHLYKERNAVERFFARIKQDRRIATRYEKTAAMCSGMLALACILTWIRF